MGYAPALVASAVAVLLSVINPYIGIFALFDLVTFFIAAVCCIIAHAYAKGLGDASGFASAWYRVAGPRVTRGVLTSTIRLMSVMLRVLGLLLATVFAAVDGTVMLLFREQGHYALPVEVIPPDMAPTLSLVLFAVRVAVGIIAAFLMWRLGGRLWRLAKSQNSK